MGALETNTTLIYGIHVRESANDGSDFTNAAADYRVLFLGEDGSLHLKDSSGTVTDIGSSAAGLAHGVRATRASGDVSVGNNVLTTIPFTSEDYDTDTMHDNSTNPSRFTIPSISGVTTGLWTIKASGYTNATTRTDAMFRKNAAGNPASGTVLAFTAASAATAVNGFIIATDAVLSAGDYVELFVRSVGALGQVTYDAAGSPLMTLSFLGKVT
jgi:hypothetical protein